MDAVYAFQALQESIADVSDEFDQLAGQMKELDQIAAVFHDNAMRLSLHVAVGCAG